LTRTIHAFDCANVPTKVPKSVTHNNLLLHSKSVPLLMIHDHSPNDPSVNDPSGSHEMAPMYFHWSTSTGSFLIASWQSANKLEYLGLCALLATLCLCREWIHASRVSLSKKKHISRVRSNDLYGQCVKNLPRIYGTFYYVLNLALAYFVMLAVMSYNIGFFLVILLFCAIGHFMWSSEIIIEDEDRSKRDNQDNKTQGSSELNVEADCCE